MRPPEVNPESTSDQAAPEVPVQPIQPESTQPEVSVTEAVPVEPSVSAASSAPTQDQPAGFVPVSPVAPSTEQPSAGAIPPLAPSPTSVVSPKQPHNKRRVLLAAIIAGAIVLLGGGAAWAFWYQHPDKVLTDAMVNAVSTQQAVMTGDFTIDSKNAALSATLTVKGKEKQGTVDVAVKFKAKTGPLAGDKEYTIDASSAVIENGDVYFKVSNVDKVVDSILETAITAQAEQYRQLGYELTDEEIATMRTQYKQMVSSVIDKINNQWIKVSADDMNKTESDKTSTCITDELKKITTDKKIRGELTDLYKANRFVVVKENLGTKNGSMGYLLDINKDAAKKFGDGIENTELGKALVKCDKDFFKDSESTSESKNDFKDTRFELWVDQWSHKITNVVFKTKYGSSDSTDMSADVKFDYATKVDDVKAPADAKSIKELQTEIEALLGTAAQSFVSTET